MPDLILVIVGTVIAVVMFLIFSILAMAFILFSDKR